MKVEKGCTICQGDVYGTKETGYYCKHCNLLFDSKQVNFSEVKKQLKEKINNHFENYEGKITEKTIGKNLVLDTKQLSTIPERQEFTRAERKDLSIRRGMKTVKTLRKIDGYEDDDKPLILEFIDNHLKKFKEHKRQAKKRAEANTKTNNKKRTKKTNSKKPKKNSKKKK